jgi:hypothetical protein
MTDQPMPCERCGEPHARCSAHTRAGRPCLQPPMSGQRVCRMHGGKTPGAVERAAERLQEAEAGRVLAKVWDTTAAPVTDAVAEMQRLAGQMRHAVDVLGSMLGGDHEPCELCGRVDVDLDSAPGVAWLRQQRELRQLLEAMERLGIAQRYVQVESARINLMAVALERVFEELALSPEQRALGGRVLLAELRAGDGQAAS